MNSREKSGTTAQIDLSILLRLVLGLLRESKGPLSTKQITLHVMAARSIDTAEKQAFELFRGRTPRAPVAVWPLLSQESTCEERGATRQSVLGDLMVVDHSHA